MTEQKTAIFSNLLSIFILVLLVSLSGCQMTDRRDYQKAFKTNTRSSYKGYLEKHPKGKHAKEAWKRLAELHAKDFELAKKTNNLKSYRQFIRKWNRGRHIREAQACYDRLLVKWALDRGNPQAFRQAMSSSFSKQTKKEMRRKWDDSLYKLAVEKLPNTDVLETYLRYLPQGRNAKRIDAMLYKEAQKRYPELTLFKKYSKLLPKGSYIQEVRESLRSAKKHHKAIPVVQIPSELKAHCGQALKWQKLHSGLLPRDQKEINRLKKQKTHVWQWTTTFSEKGGKIGYWLSATGGEVEIVRNGTRHTRYLTAGSYYGSRENFFYGVEKLVVPAGGTKHIRQFIVCDGMCDGYALWEATGRDEAGNRLTFNKKILLKCPRKECE